MATELTDYYTAKIATYETLIASTTSALGSAMELLFQVNTSLDEATAELGGLDATIDQMRLDMSNPALTPADIEALALALRQALIDRRKKNVEYLDLRAQVDSVENNRNATEAMLVLYQSAHEQCQSAAEASADSAAQHTDWYSTESAGQIAELVSASQTLLAELTATPDPAPIPDSEEELNRLLIEEADTRITGDIPAVLRNRATSRQQALVAGFATQIASLRDVTVDARLSHLADKDGTHGELEQQWVNYRRNENAVRVIALNSASQFDRALDLLRAVVNTPDLTAAESARINDPAIALEADSAAIETEAALNVAQAAVFAKEAELEQAILAAQMIKPTVDPSSDGDVQTVQGELDSLIATELVPAEGNHTADLALALDTWEVAVPDPVWQALGSYQKAIELLTAIAGADFAAAKTAFTAAETALVAALNTQETNTQVQAISSAAVNLAEQRHQFTVESFGMRTHSTLRGEM